MGEKMYNEAIRGGLIPFFLLRCVRAHGFVYIIIRCNTDNGYLKCL